MKLFSFTLWEWWDKDFQREISTVCYAETGDEKEILIKARQYIFIECMEEFPEQMIDEHNITKPEDWEIIEEKQGPDIYTCRYPATCYFISKGGHVTEWGDWMQYTVDNIREITNEEWLEEQWKKSLIGEEK